MERFLNFLHMVPEETAGEWRELCRGWVHVSSHGATSCHCSIVNVSHAGVCMFGMTNEDLTGTKRRI